MSASVTSFVAGTGDTIDTRASVTTVTDTAFATDSVVTDATATAVTDTTDAANTPWVEMINGLRKL